MTHLSAPNKLDMLAIPSQEHGGLTKMSPTTMLLTLPWVLDLIRQALVLARCYHPPSETSFLRTAPHLSAWMQRALQLFWHALILSQDRIVFRVQNHQIANCPVRPPSDLQTVPASTRIASAGAIVNHQKAHQLVQHLRSKNCSLCQYFQHHWQIRNCWKLERKCGRSCPIRLCARAKQHPKAARQFLLLAPIRQTTHHRFLQQTETAPVIWVHLAGLHHPTLLQGLGQAMNLANLTNQATVPRVHPLRHHANGFPSVCHDMAILDLV